MSKKDKARELLKRVLTGTVHLSEIETYLQTEAPMGMDDLAAEMQTINDLRNRLATLTAVKNSYQSTINDLQEKIMKLAKENARLENERDCILLDLKDLQNRLDKAEK